MPNLVLSPKDESVAALLDRHFDTIAPRLAHAAAVVIGYKEDEFVVILEDPPRRITQNANPLTIQPFASEGVLTRGKTEMINCAMTLAWSELLKQAGMEELAEGLPPESVAVWTQVAPGARWALMSELLPKILSAN